MCWHCHQELACRPVPESFDACYGMDTICLYNLIHLFRPDLGVVCQATGRTGQVRRPANNWLHDVASGALTWPRFAGQHGRTVRSPDAVNRLHNVHQLNRKNEFSHACCGCNFECSVFEDSSAACNPCCGVLSICRALSHTGVIKQFRYLGPSSTCSISIDGPVVRAFARSCHLVLQASSAPQCWTREESRQGATGCNNASTAFRKD